MFFAPLDRPLMQAVVQHWGQVAAALQNFDQVIVPLAELNSPEYDAHRAEERLLPRIIVETETRNAESIMKEVDFYGLFHVQILGDPTSEQLAMLKGMNPEMWLACRPTTRSREYLTDILPLVDALVAPTEDPVRVDPSTHCSLVLRSEATDSGISTLILQYRPAAIQLVFPVEDRRTALGVELELGRCVPERSFSFHSL